MSPRRAPEHTGDSETAGFVTSLILNHGFHMVTFIIFLERGIKGDL